MAFPSHVYTKAQTSLATKLANVSADALKVMLLSAYTPGQNTHQFLSDVLAAGTEVANGNGYTTGGQALANLTLTQAGTVVTLSCDNPTWSPRTNTAAYAVFCDSTPAERRCRSSSWMLKTSSATGSLLNHSWSRTVE